MTRTARLILAAVFAAAAPLGADTYQFDKAHTNVGFQVRHIFTMVSKTLETGGVLIGEEVKVQIAVEANKAKPQPAAN